MIYGKHRNEKLSIEIGEELSKTYRNNSNIEFIRRIGIEKRNPTFKAKMSLGIDKYLEELLDSKSFVISLEDCGPYKSVNWKTIQTPSWLKCFLLIKVNYGSIADIKKFGKVLSDVKNYAEAIYGRVNFIFSKGIYHGNIAELEFITNYENHNIYEKTKKIGIVFTMHMIDLFLSI